MQKLSILYEIIKCRPSSKIRLLFLFRYISLFLTSLFYLLSPQTPFTFRVGVVLLVVVASGIITRIQQKYFENTTILKSTVLAETFGLTLLLIPTGGISSFFIWYALNPVLMAASFLSTSFCYAALFFYFGSATFIAYFFFQKIPLMMILKEESYFYLVCLLIVLLAKLFSQLTKELDTKATLLKTQQDDLLKMNLKLKDANERYQLTLDHIMSMYSLIDNFSTDISPSKIAEEITTFLKNCTKNDSVFYWLTDVNHKNSYLANKTNLPDLETFLKHEWNSLRARRGLFIYQIKNDHFLMRIIRTSEYIGILGINVTCSTISSDESLLNRTFEFLAELSEILIEKIHLDEMIGQMLIIEEQNRIANEIHDSVTQRLFGIVCTLHSLQVQGQAWKWEDLSKEIQLLLESANSTIKELRSVIYCLSTIKKGEKPFLLFIKNHLDEFSKLNNVRVKCHFNGDESLISEKLKQGLYRIICEACGNAVRHGECTVIELNFSILDDKTVLQIKDDGMGIYVFNVTSREKGIGLLNMKNIVSSFDGTFSIEGIPDLGTILKVEIPNYRISKSLKVVG